MRPFKSAPRVLVYVDLDLVGDALIKLPLIRALRQAFPDGEIVWVAGRGPSAFAGALAPLVTGLLDRVIAHAGWRAAIGPGRPDLILDTQGRLSTLAALALLRPRRLVSIALQYPKPRHLVARLLALLERATGVPARPDAPLHLPDATVALAASLLPPGPVYIAQAIGAGGRHKAWPRAHHIALARDLAATGRTPVIILGPDEHAEHAELASLLPTARFPRQEALALGHDAGPDLTIALAGRCAAGVAGDCGGGHMLAASGIALVSLFGPTDPGKFAPSATRLSVLRAQDFGGGSEMAAIPVAAVLAALTAIAVPRVKQASGGKPATGTGLPAEP